MRRNKREKEGLGLVIKHLVWKLRRWGYYGDEVNEWNLLPQEVVDATSVNQFKNRLDKFRQRYGH